MQHTRSSSPPSAPTARARLLTVTLALGLTGCATQLDRGQAAYEQGAYAEAYAIWSVQAHETGDPHAQYLVGLMHEDGTGVPRNRDRAVEWYRRAAAQGFAPAQNNLGMLVLDRDPAAASSPTSSADVSCCAGRRPTASSRPAWSSPAASPTTRRRRRAICARPPGPSTRWSARPATRGRASASE